MTLLFNTELEAVTSVSKSQPSGHEIFKLATHPCFVRDGKNKKISLHLFYYHSSYMTLNSIQ